MRPKVIAALFYGAPFRPPIYYIMEAARRGTRCPCPVVTGGETLYTLKLL
jgi:hypothetical protein